MGVFFIGITFLGTLSSVAFAGNDNPSVIERKIHINMRVMDWTNLKSFDQNEYTKGDYVRVWDNYGKKEEMVPFSIDSSWYEPIGDSSNLGEVMDKINAEVPPSSNPENKDKHKQIFKYNIDDVSKAGELGRFLYGVLKKDQSTVHSVGQPPNYYWGINNIYNSVKETIQSSDKYYSYLSLTSPNSIFATTDSHVNFDWNESLYAYDNRLRYGIDKIGIEDEQIFNINTWRMIGD